MLSGLRLAKICWMVGCFPASSSSSQWAPSNTGVVMNVDASVVGRVLVSVPQAGASPTAPDFGVLPSQPQGGVAEVGLEHLADVHPARARRAG